MWLELLYIAIVSGTIVVGIEAYNNNWYERLVSYHKIVVAARITNLDSRDVNYLLELTGRYVELNNQLYTNVVVGTRCITNRMARQILVYKMCCQEVI